MTYTRFSIGPRSNMGSTLDFTSETKGLDRPSSLCALWAHGSSTTKMYYRKGSVAGTGPGGTGFSVSTPLEYSCILFRPTYTTSKYASYVHHNLYIMLELIWLPQLFAMYIAGSPVPHAMYAVVGHGIRLAIDMGAHKRVAYGARPTVEDELKKRAMW